MNNRLLFIPTLLMMIFLLNCTESNDNSKAPNQIDYLKKGKELALASKATLGKNLKKAITENGTEYAISFCNIQASQLTEGLSDLHSAHIKRVSDKNRNPKNAGNKEELDYIDLAKSALVKGQQPKGKVTDKNGKVIGYYPIVTNGLCLQCHGKPNEEITASTMAKLNELYPEDKATGYGLNELRGIWVIEMDKK